MAYLGYKRIALREYKEEQERIKLWKEAEKLRKRKAKQKRKVLVKIANHIFLAIILIAIFYLL